MAGPWREEILGDGQVRLICADCREALKTLPENSVDSVVTDPPYHLTAQFARASKGFMGKTWDGGDIAFQVDTWSEVMRVMKPGAHLVAFGGTRTFHRMACAIEDAGFEIRDTLMWVYGTGFPKSHDVSKGIDKAAGAEREVVAVSPHARPSDGRTFNALGVTTRPPITAPATAAAREWQGWGTALKPAVEPIILARKPLSESTVAANVLRWGTGAINIDGCRIATDAPRPVRTNERSASGLTGTGGAVTYGRYAVRGSVAIGETTLGRWPANLIHDGSDEVVAMFPQADSARASGNPNNPRHGSRNRVATSYDWNPERESHDYRDRGSAARFFYAAKASRADRAGSKHPTVKPISLMHWLTRLTTPPGGLVLDPFAGSGTTGAAALEEGMRCLLIERESEYQSDIIRRIKLHISNVLKQPDMFIEKPKPPTQEALGL